MNLKNYIYESLNVFKITKEQFIDIFNSVDSMDCYEDEYINKYAELCGGYKNYINLVHYLDWHRNSKDIDKLYDQIQNAPQRKIDKILGVGTYGAVFDFGKDRVIKVFGPEHNKMSSKANKYENKFYEYCLKHNFKYFPKVYKFVKDKYVIMEKLETSTPELKDFYKKVMKDKPEFNECILYQVKYSDKNQRDVLNSKEDKKLYDWCWDVKKEFEKIASPSEYTYYPGDFTSNNIGLRPGTKEIVYFDI